MPEHDNDERDVVGDDDARTEVAPAAGGGDDAPRGAGAVALGDHDAGHDHEVRVLDDDDEEFDDEGGGGGRWLSVIGALVVAGALFLTWYQITRRNGFTDDTTGFQTFNKLRWLILAGSLVTIVTALLAQTRSLAILRTVIGVVVALLVLRRVVSPPDLSTASVTSQLGIYVALFGALAMAFGGLLDLGGGVGDDELDEADAEGVDGLEGDHRPVAALDAGDHEPDVVDAEVVDDDPRPRS